MSNLVKLYPIIVSQSRYSGVHEGGTWYALPNADSGFMWSDLFAGYIFGEIEEAALFWGSDESHLIGRGNSPNAAVLNLLERHFGVGQWEHDDEPGAAEGRAEERGEEGSGPDNGATGPETSGLLP